MTAEIKLVNLEDNPTSPLALRVVLEPSKEYFDIVLQALDDAGYIFRVWENREIILLNLVRRKTC